MIGYLDSFQQDRQRHQERERCRKTKNKASLWTVFYISLFDALFYSRNFISSFLLRGWKSEWWSLGEHLINKTYLGKKCLVLIEVHKFHIFFTLLIGCTCTVVLQNKRERGSGWTLDGSNWSPVWQRSVTSITRVSLRNTRSPPECLKPPSAAVRICRCRISESFST